jgi:hypothetical protein
MRAPDRKELGRPHTVPHEAPEDGNSVNPLGQDAVVEPVSRREASFAG